MLRQCTALFLLLAFLASTFSKAVIVVDFYANQDYIAKNLCENRDKPIMHCGGRCQLRKRLSREDSQDRKNPERRTEIKQEVFLPQDLVHQPAPPASRISNKAQGTTSSASPIDRPTDIFHPPVTPLL